MLNKPLIVVLLSTYNGEKYLEEQIESILKQRNVEVFLLVRDDGSSDQTISILKEYQERGCLKFYTGENKQPAKSFMDLIYSSPNAPYYAFCDQDDYWLDDKLEIAVNALERERSDIPCLYYGMPRIVDEKLKLIQPQPTAVETMTTFNSCLVNSKATGCTMVFNKSLCDLLKSAKPEYVLMHDAWVHKVCLALEGKVIFDPDVHILYRQHGNNVVGVPKGFLGKIRLYVNELKNDDQMRSRCVRSLVESYGNLMAPDKKRKAEIVANYQESLTNTLRLFFDRKIKTDYWKRNLMYKSAVLLRRY